MIATTPVWKPNEHTDGITDLLMNKFTPSAVFTPSENRDRHDGI